MSEHRFSAVPIISDRKVVGIVTEDDLLRREELGTSSGLLRRRTD